MGNCLILALIGLISGQALGFSLSEHASITSRAVNEFLACAPHSLNSLEIQSLIQGNLKEDLDLPTKWVLWSHFYHPEKELSMRRGSSAGRIRQLSEQISQEAKDDFRLDYSDMVLEVPMPMEVLGHALHHIQDMASPPHVVPVMHGLFDGFESYDVSLPEIPLQKITCDFISKGKSQTLTSIHHQTSVETLARVRPGGDAGVPVIENGIDMRVWWNAFWQEKSGGEFGEYGFLGNNFGKEKFEYEGSSYSIDAKYYREFKIKQLRQAIDYTKLALARVLAKRIPN